MHWTMAGNASSNRAERTEAGLRDGRKVHLTRCSTQFPRGSEGRWRGNIYQIIGAGVVLYESREVPPELREQLGPGTVTFKGLSATITFNRNNGDLSQYFLGYP